MQYRSVNEIAKKWNVSERSVRNYCAQGRVEGAFLTGKTWNIPENAEKPERSNKKKEPPITLRPGIFLKMQKSRSVPIKRKNRRLPCWIFCRNRRRANIQVAFTIRHRLI